MSTNINLSAILTRAHKLTRSAIATAPADMRNYSATFSACLRMAWSESGVSTAPQKAVDSIRAEWDALTAEEQLELVKNQVKRAARDVIGYSVEDHYSQYWEKPAFTYGTASLGDYWNETFRRVLDNWERQARHNAERAANGCKPRTLKSYVKACAKQAVMCIYRAEYKHGSAARDFVDADGERQSIVETLCPSGDDTAREVVFAYALEQFRASRDAIDNAIIDALTAGKNYRAIGESLNMSHVAVVKRVAKLRKAMVESGIAPQSWSAEQ